MKDEILKILESYITDGYRTERCIYDNDIDDVADELVKLFTIHNLRSDYFNYLDSLEESKHKGSSFKNKTAIEWLVENSPLGKNDFWDEIIEQAKKIEKRQIIESFNEGEDLGDRRNYTGDKYYEAKFKTINPGV